MRVLANLSRLKNHLTHFLKTAARRSGGGVLPKPTIRACFRLTEAGLWEQKVAVEEQEKSAEIHVAHHPQITGD